ncbi:MAG: murein hydrolase activator EnvC family protein [Saccharofermentanales bacterium]
MAMESDWTGMKSTDRRPGRQTGRSKAIRSWAAVLASALVLSWFSAGIFTPLDVESATSIADLNDKQDQIEQKLAALKKEKEALSNQSKELKGELQWLNSKTQQERDKYTGLVNELNSAYTEMEQAIKEATDAERILGEKQEQYKSRLQAMFENRNKGTLEMLFDADDLTSFLANAQLISIIAENDKDIIGELNAAKDEAFLKKQAADEYCEEMQAYVDKKKAEIEALKKSISSTKTNLSKTEEELSKAVQDEKALQAESEKIAKEIKKLQSSMAYYGGAMVWPTPGYTGINAGNGFGMRLHPVYHYMKMHNGIDINAPFNAKIVAAAAGKVIVVHTIYGYNPVAGNNYGGSGYGNYIIVDHGGGIATLYAHCKLVKVKTGDAVKAGQWIAVTGSTGLSTGAHLHFEVRENGAPVNPLQKKYLGVKK